MFKQGTISTRTNNVECRVDNLNLDFFFNCLIEEESDLHESVSKESRLNTLYIIFFYIS